MASSSHQPESDNVAQDASATIEYNGNKTADNEDGNTTIDDNDSKKQNKNLKQVAPVVTRPRPTAPALQPVQHLQYESLPALNLNHPPFYGTYRDSTDGVPQYHPFSDEEDEDEEYADERDEFGNRFSRTQRVDHAYGDQRPDREGGQQRDDEESDSGGNGRRSRWERRRGAIMRMRTAIIWIVGLPLLLVAFWVCVNLFRKEKSSWETEKR